MPSAASAATVSMPAMAPIMPSGATSMPPMPTEQELAAYYRALPVEYGYASQCRMELMGDIRGKRVLDVDCRRGKGVIKLSDWVGQKGFVLGIDPHSEFVDIALSYMDDAWRKNGLLSNNMDYRVAFPERFVGEVVEKESFDVVFCNSSIMLDYSLPLVVREAFHALRPGGMLIYDGVLSQDPRDEGVRQRARKIGNAIQAAVSVDEFSNCVCSVGFDAPEFHNISIADPASGFDGSRSFPVVEADENATFLRLTALVYKSRYAQCFRRFDGPKKR